jgi:hypothetical protein
MMDATQGLAAILRDAHKGALLRMRSELAPVLGDARRRDPLARNDGLNASHAQPSSPAKERVKDTDLILRSLRSKRLEGWTQTQGLAAILRDARKGALLQR